MSAFEPAAIDAFRLIDRLWATHFAPPADLTVEQWADERLILPREMASEPGPMRLSRTPYLRQIFADLADPRVEEIDLMFGTQLGKSTALLALMAYIIDHDPAPMMLVQPTLDLGKKFSKQRIAPLIAANPCLADKVRDARSRDSGNTTLVKEFAGGILVITGANSPAGLASMPVKVLLFDEVDDYPDDAGGQGEPVKLATARQDTFARRKRVKCSSPKQPKGRSTIERGFETGTGCEYYVPCPDCGHRQTLKWGNLRWQSDPELRPETAAYACEACGSLIGEHHKTAMLAGGAWVAARPDARTKSYRLNSLYSPLGWLSWAALVREWLEAAAEKDRGNLLPLRTFVNTRLCETWEEQAERFAANELQEKADAFPLKTVPLGALLLVAGVDVQDDRFEIDVWGVGENGDDWWTVDTRVIPANPGLEADWAKLDAALQERYPHAAGQSMGIEAAGIDTGGHYTHDTYRFIRKLPSWRKVAALKGQDRPGMPVLGKASTVDVNWRGGVIKHGVKLWMVGVNAAKDLLFNRVKAGRMHFSRELPAAWFEQLAAEHRITVRTARGERQVWAKKTAGARNESLDKAVYALWCAERLGVSRWPRKYWDALRQRVTPDLFTPRTDGPVQQGDPAADAPPPASAAGGADAPARTAKPRRTGFVNRWKR